MLQHIPDFDAIKEIYTLECEDDIAQAAILDVAGVRPHFARKIQIGHRGILPRSDLILLAAGVKSMAGESPQDVLETNIRLIDEIFQGVILKPSAILVTIPGPVELLAMYLSIGLKHPPEKVLGFGGDLDLNRLHYILTDMGIQSHEAHVVGEHGARVIPIYEGERSYAEAARRVRGFLSSIDRLAGVKRNLASAPLLARLIESLLGDEARIHHVANPHPDHGVWLTWPYHIQRQGVVRVQPLVLPAQAEEELKTLVETRQRDERELEDLMR